MASNNNRKFCAKLFGELSNAWNLVQENQKQLQKADATITAREKLNQGIHQLEQQNQQAKQVRQQLEQKFQQLKQENQQLEQKFQQLKQENQQLKQENQQLEQGSQQLEPGKQQLEQRRQQLEQELQQLEQGLQQLKQDSQQLEQGKQQMDSIIAGSYRQAVITGEHAAHQFKLVMLGPEGGGKTSTVYSLLGKDFQPHQPSTVGADVSNTCTADRHCVTDWKLKELDHHLQDISIHYKYELRQAMVESMDDVFEEESVKSEHDVVAGTDVLQNKMTPEGKIRIVIYDLGGQEVYYEIQFLFLASHDTVFLTFDASKKLDAPVVRRQRYTISQEVYKTKKTQTNYEAIETTLHAVYSHCGIEGNKDSLSPRIPTVVMVGTHAFNLTIDEKDVISKMLIKRLCNKPLFDHLPRNTKDAIHFIDNKERDVETFNHLKAVAIKAAQFAITEMRPIPYLKYEENILEISQKETEISIEKACDVAFKAGLDDSPESLLALLQYYTFKGILLYYPDIEELKNRIFISPQQVSNLVSCVIKTHDYAEPMPNFMLRRKFDRFDKFGILEESLLDYMLERSNYAKNIVLGFLEHFDLAVEIDRCITFENEDDTYRPPDTGRVFFIPSMLVYNEKEKYIKPQGHIDNVMLYHFPDKFLPETVFNHVLISTIKWCQNNGHRICRILHGIGVFDFNNGKQGFTLQQCSVTFSIKCYIFVLQREVCNKDLWQQRWDLLQQHLKSFVFDAHNRCIPKAQQPITYVECPLEHDKSCVPHIRLDALTPDNDVWCTKENPKRLISRSAYNLLLNPDNQPETVAKLVDGAVVFNSILNKDEVPSMRDLNRYVVAKHASEWEDIATELDLDKEIAIIEKDNRRSVDCLKKTLRKWLDSTPCATWKKLEVAITNVKRAKLSLDPITDVYASEGRGTKRRISSSQDASLNEQSKRLSVRSTSDQEI